MLDQWTSLFLELEQKVSIAGRRDLLRKCIEQVEAVAQLNLGRTGIDRPSEWKGLKLKYAVEYHDGDQTPTLILSGEMLRSFKTNVQNNSATLTNAAEYSSIQQLGSTGFKSKIKPDNYKVTLYRASHPTIKFSDIFSANKLKAQHHKEKKGDFWTTSKSYADYFKQSYGPGASIKTIYISQSELYKYHVEGVEYKIPKSVSLKSGLENESESTGVPPRPFFPVTPDNQLTPFVLARFREILDAHFEISV